MIKISKIRTLYFDVDISLMKIFLVQRMTLEHSLRWYITGI